MVCLLKVLAQSLLCSIMFQFKWMNIFISWLLGLNLVCLSGFCITNINLSCVNFAALSMCFYKACSGYPFSSSIQ